MLCLDLAHSTQLDDGLYQINVVMMERSLCLRILCGTNLTPFRKGSGTIDLEIPAAVEMAFPIEMIMHG